MRFLLLLFERVGYYVALLVPGFAGFWRMRPRTPLRWTNRLIRLPFKLHVIELVRQYQPRGALARLQGAELVVLLVLLVDDLSAQVYVFDLLFLHLVVFFLGHLAIFLLSVVVGLRLRLLVLIRRGVRRLLLPIAFILMYDIIYAYVYVV